MPVIYIYIYVCLNYDRTIFHKILETILFKIVAKLHWISGFRRLKITPALMPFFRTVEGGSGPKKSPSDRWYEAMTEWGALSMGFTLGIFSGQFMTPLTDHKSWRLRARVRTQEMQKPSLPWSCCSENPQHLAHVWSQERCDLHWQPALQRALTRWLCVTQANTL